MGSRYMEEDTPPLRSSKIPLALRRNLISAIEEGGMNIKTAAARFRINYSSAKLIYRRYKDEKLAKLRAKKGNTGADIENDYDFQDVREKKRCSYKSINQKSTNSNTESFSSSGNSKVTIISTVAWNYMKDGLPSHPFQKKI